MPIGTAQGLEDAAAGQGVRAEDRGAGDRAADTHRTHVGGRNLAAGTRGRESCHCPSGPCLQPEGRERHCREPVHGQGSTEVPI